jgi:ribosomal protein S18 acetylase RimI-like enzyme
MSRSANTIRALAPGDEAALERFLVRHADSSMFLRANAAAFGLRDHGERLQGSYVAALDEHGEVTGVAAHYRNNVLVVQAPGAAAILARRAAEESVRPVGGLVGPAAQVIEARAALGFETRRASLDSEEVLYALDLDELQVPASLGEYDCRAPASEAERERASEWRAAYTIEALGRSSDDDLDAQSRDEIDRLVARGDLWLLVRRGGAVVSMTAASARLPDMVTIGGVYTPPALRGRGYGRAAVAGQLVDLRRTGVRRAVLFTPRDNQPARRAYEALGFRVVGDYGLILFAPDNSGDG